MSITIEVGGKQYGGFLSARVDLVLDELSNQFALEATSEKGRPLPFLGGERCRIRVDGESVITGLIERVNPVGDEGTHSINIAGRDLTADLVASQIAAMDDLRAPISLREVIEAVIEHIGSSLEVVEDIQTDPFTEAEDLIAPEPGDGAFEFLSKYARKRQALITSDGLGRVVIARASGLDSAGAIIHRPDDPRNNVLRYNATFDRSELFHRYVNAGQLNPLAAILGSLIDKDSVADQPAEVIDDEIQPGRQFVMTDDTLGSSGQTLDMIEWERNVRRSRARQASFTVHRFRNQGGQLWLPNRRVRVDSPYVGVNSVMLTNRVSFGISEGDGSTTTLVVIPRDAFTIAQSRPEKEQEVAFGLALPS